MKEMKINLYRPGSIRELVLSIPLKDIYLLDSFQDGFANYYRRDVIDSLKDFLGIEISNYIISPLERKTRLNLIRSNLNKIIKEFKYGKFKPPENLIIKKRSLNLYVGVIPNSVDCKIIQNYVYRKLNSKWIEIYMKNLIINVEPTNITVATTSLYPKKEDTDYSIEFSSIITIKNVVDTAIVALIYKITQQIIISDARRTVNTLYLMISNYNYIYIINKINDKP